jgi:pyridoxamine 5'-phosphate oxidase
MSGWDISTTRHAYREPDEIDLRFDPIVQLRAWIDAAHAAGSREANSMALSTAGEDCRPSSRMVLLRGLDDRGLIFFTSYFSRKGRELSRNPFASALFFWPEIHRQVSVEGSVEQLPENESDAYFASRPRGHQLSAWASEQSEEVESRQVLEQRLEDFANRFEGDQVPRPHSWGGFLLRPGRFEFWQGRSNRMHDRIELRRDGGAWMQRRLQP